MTKMESNNTDNSYDEKSCKELLGEIFKLTLKLFWKIFTNLTNSIFAGAKWLATTTKNTTEKIVEWWKANDTQVKIRFIRLNTRRLIKLCLKWVSNAAKKLANHTSLLFRLLIKSIIDLKPTIVSIGKKIAHAYKKCIEWLSRQIKKIKHSNARRKVQYKKFRKHPGFKGLLIDIGLLLKSNLNSFMEEEQTEFTGEFEDIEEKILNDTRTDINKPAQNFGKRIITSVKDVVES